MLFESFFETTANTTYSGTRLDQLRPVNLVERPPRRVCGSSNAPTTTDSHKDLMENFYRLLGSYQACSEWEIAFVALVSCAVAPLIPHPVSSLMFFTQVLQKKSQFCAPTILLLFSKYDAIEKTLFLFFYFIRNSKHVLIALIFCFNMPMNSLLIQSLYCLVIDLHLLLIDAMSLSSSNMYQTQVYII